MKLTIRQADMEYGLGLVIGAVDKKRIGEAAGSVLVRALAGDRVELHATDLELFASITLEAAVATGGDSLLPADKIAAAIKACGSGEVAFSASDLLVAIDGSLASYEIKGIGPEDYPVGPTDCQDIAFEFPAGKLAACIGAVEHAAGTDPAKPSICGINFRLSDAGRLTVAATDGHRLSLAGMDIPGEHIIGKGLAHEFTVPQKATQILGKITATVSAGRVAKQCRLYFRSGSISVCSAEGTREFSDVRMVIPTGVGDVVTVARAALIDALESCCIMSDDSYRSVNLDISREQIIVSALGVNSTARANVPCLCDCDIKLRINSRYLLQAIKSLEGDEIFIKYFGPASPVMLIPADHRGWDERLEILMPLKCE